MFEILYFPHIIFNFWMFFLQEKNSITKYISDEFSNHDLMEYHFSTEHCSWTNWATNLYYHSSWRFLTDLLNGLVKIIKKNKKWIDYSKIFIGVAFSLSRVVPPSHEWVSGKSGVWRSMQVSGWELRSEGRGSVLPSVRRSVIPSFGSSFGSSFGPSVMPFT